MLSMEALGGAVGWDTALQAGRSRVWFPTVSLSLWSTQPLTEMSTKIIPWGDNSGQCVGLTNLPPSCADCNEIWEPQPPGTLRACPQELLCL